MEGVVVMPAVFSVLLSGLKSWVAQFSSLVPGSYAPEREIEFVDVVYISRSGEPGNEGSITFFLCLRLIPRTRSRE